MNFLALCKRLRSEAGMSGTGPTTTVSQSGDSLKIVEWINSAYEDIQNSNPYFKFMRKPFSFSTVVDQQAYTPTEAGITDFERWKKDQPGDIRIYLATTDESYLTYIPWDTFKAIYIYGSSRDSKGRPSFCSVEPDNSLTLYQIPNVIFTINGEYYRSPDELSGDSDEPIFPAQFHMAIVWRALMFYGAFDAADEKYTHGQNEFKRIMARLRKDQLPGFKWGAPLA